MTDATRKHASDDGQTTGVTDSSGQYPSASSGSYIIVPSATNASSPGGQPIPSTGPAEATWLKAQNGTFSVGGNWTGGSAPTTTALFETGTLTPYTVTGTSAASATVATIDVGDLVTFAGKIDSTTIVNVGNFGAHTGTLTIGGVLTTPTVDLTTAAAALTLSAGGTLVGGAVAEVAATIANAGTVDAASAIGVNLMVGGLVTNADNAVIVSRNGYGIQISGSGTIVNSGTITGSGTSAGVVLLNGGTVFNVGTASLISNAGTTNAGINVYNDAAFISNAGTIRADTTTSANRFAIGIFLDAGGTISNNGTAALIAGEEFGVQIQYAPGTVTNSGTILGTGLGQAVELDDGGTLANTGTSALISAPDAEGGAIAYFNPIVVTNAGTIVGGKYGVYLHEGGTVTNSGTISGGVVGVKFKGTIDALLILQSGGTLIGGADAAGTGSNTLDLAAGGVGTISGLGAAYAGFQTLEISPTARWNFTGADTLASGGTLINSGTGIVANTLDITGAVTGSGTLIVASAATLEIGGTIAAGQTIDFTGSNDVVQFGATAGLSGILSGVGATDTIDLVSLSSAGATTTLENANTLLVNSGGTSVALALGTGAFYTHDVFTPSSDGATGTDIIVSMDNSPATATWLTAQSGTFSVGGNWTGGLVPTTLAEFETGSLTPYTVTGTSAATANVATIDVGDIVTFTGTIDSTGSVEVGKFGTAVGTLTVGGTLTTGTVDLTNSGASLDVTGTLLAKVSASVSASVTNSGSILGSGTAIDLAAGGTVTNTGTAALISNGAAGYGVLVAGGVGSVTNHGTIIGSTKKSAVFLEGGGTIANIGTSALILDEGTSQAGVYVQGGVGIVSNAGTIGTSFADAFGVVLLTGGTITNVGSASLIYGGVNHQGIYARAAVTVSNSGTILSPSNYAAVALYNGGTVTNTGGAALIKAGTTGGTIDFGVEVYNAAGVITNTGTILAIAGVAAVDLMAGGTVTNAALTGLIGDATGQIGVLVSGSGGTVVNAGTITGSVDAISFNGTSGASNLLVNDPGAVFSGAVTAPGTDSNTLDLAVGSGASGTLTGLGTQFTGFQTLEIDSAAFWQFSGANTLANGGILVNSGTGLVANTLDISGAVQGSGTLVITSAATLQIGGTIASGAAIDFTGIHDVLRLGSTAGLSGTLFGLAGTDTIDLSSLSSAGATVTLESGDTLLVNSGGTSVALALGTGGSYTHDVFTPSSDGASGTDIVVSMATSTPTAMWLTAQSGTFSVGSNWTGGLVPSNTALFETGTLSPYTVTGTSAASATVATIDVGDIVTFAGSIDATTIVDVGDFNAQTGTLTIGGLLTTPTVDLTTAGAALTLSAGGTLVGGAAASVVATIVNAGSVTNTATSGAGIYLQAGGVVTNSATSALIYGTFDGVRLVASGTLLNSGTVSGNNGHQGIELDGGGTVVNTGTGALITAASDGVAVSFINAPGTVINTGTIRGDRHGVVLNSGGTIINSGTASAILGVTSVGIVLDAGTPGVITNAGTISGSYGIVSYGGGTISNTGTIVSPNAAIKMTGGGTLINDGTLSGSVAVKFLGTSGVSNLLVVDPGAVFVGSVLGTSTAQNTLDLASSVNSGTLTSLGTQFTGFQTLEIDSGAKWLFSGANNLASGGTLINSGTATIANTLDITGAVQGSGTLVVASGATLEIGGALAATQTIDFNGANDFVQFGTTSGLSGKLSGLAIGDTIDLSGLAYGAGASTTINTGAHTLTVTTPSGTITLALDPATTYGTAVATASQDSGTGTDIVLSGSSVFSWATANPGIFSIGGNWIGGAAPNNAADTALFETGTLSPYTVTGTSSASATVATIDVGDLVTFAGTIGATGIVNVGTFGTHTGTLTIGGILATPTVDLIAAGASLAVSAGGTLSGMVVAAVAATITNAGLMSSTTDRGILLTAGGLVSNTTATATISGSTVGVDIIGAGTISNAGTIRGTAQYQGVDLENGGTVFNLGSASLIEGGANGVGVGVYGAAGFVSNFGSILGMGESFAISLTDGGTITNASTTSVISGGTFVSAVLIGGASGLLTNDGTIVSASTTGAGVELDAGGTILNVGSLAVISGGSAGVAIFVTGNRGTIMNSGTVLATGTATAIALYDGGSVTNLAANAVVGGAATGVGVYIKGGNGVVTNAGTISGSQYAVYFGGTSVTSNLLVVDPGAAFVGDVTAPGTDSNMLELAVGSGGQGLLTGLGTQFTGFQKLEIDGAARWLFSGANTLAAGGTLINSGTGIIANTLDITGAVQGSGTLVVGSGATLEIGGALAAAQTIDFTGANGVAQFGATAGLSGILSGLVPGDTIDLSSLASAGATATLESGNTLLVKSGATSVTLTLNPSGSYASDVFAPSSDGASGTDIVISAATSTPTATWLTAQNGVFSVGSFWTGGLVPTNTALFETGTLSPYTVTGTSSASATVATIDVGDIVTFAGTVGATGIVNVGGFGARTGTLTVGGLVTSPTVDLTTAGAALTVSVGGTLQANTYAKTAATVTNSGTITGSGKAILLNGGGLVTNATTTSSIYGSGYLAAVTVGFSGSVVNLGTISTKSGDQGIDLENGGIVNNVGSTALISATMESGADAIIAYTSAGTITNAGTIQGRDSGISLEHGGTVTNTGPTSLILAGNDQADTGIAISSANGVVTNAGTVAGNFGINLNGGGTITNSGTIAGSHIAVYTYGGATVINSGSIIGIGTPDALELGGDSGAANLLIVDPGAVFVGYVVGATTMRNTLDLAAGVNSGTISSLGTQFIGFQTLEIDSGATWRFGGTNTLASGGTLINSGTGTIANTLDITGSVQGSGTLVVASGATLEIGGALAAAQTIDFTGANEVAQFGTTAGLSGVLSGLVAGDTVDLSSLASAGATATLVSGNRLLVKSGATSVTLSLDPSGAYTNDLFTPSGDGANGTDIVISAATSTPTATWLTAQSGVFSVGSFWTGGLVPTNTALFETGTLSPYTVTGTSSASATVATIDVGDIVTFAGTIGATGSVDIGAFNSQIGTLIVAGALTTPTIDLTSAGASLDVTGSLSGGVVATANDTVATTGTAALINTGTSGTAIGVYGGPAGVSNAGTIEGGSRGVVLNFGGSITNSGSIVSDGSGGGGVIGYDGGTVTNVGTLSSISGTVAGIHLEGAAGTVNNAGAIGGGLFGIDLSANGTVSNSGTIVATEAGGFGIGASAGGTIVNNGTTSGITGVNDGVYVRGGAGIITNAGTIQGGTFGVDLVGGGTLTDSGVISGATAIAFGGNGANLLSLDGTARVSGSVTGSATAQNTLDLAAATGAGTIASLGTQYTGFQTLEIDPSAQWSFSGANTLAAGGTLINSGTGIVANTLDITGAVRGSGTLIVASAATLEIDGALAAGQTIDFTGANDLVRFGTTSGLSGTLSGLALGDTIDLSALAYGGGATATIDTGAHTLTVTTSGGTVTLALDPATAYGNAIASTSQDSGTGTDIVLSGSTVFSWATANAGIFSIGGNWVGGAAPNSTLDTALFETGSSTAYTVTGTSSASATVGTIDIGDLVSFAGTVGAKGSVDIGAFNSQTGTLTVGGTLTAPALILNATGAALSVASGAMVVGRVDATSLATITNAGTIESGSANAIQFGAGGTVINSGTGSTVLGASVGVYAHGQVTVTNSGTIRAAGYNDSYGVRVGQGVITNTGTMSSIYGERTGVEIDDGTGTIFNAGTISANGSSGYYGVILDQGGTITNAGSLSLILGTVGIATFGGGTIVNAGTILGFAGYGIRETGFEVVTNTGTISAELTSGVKDPFPAIGVSLSNGTVANTGSLATIYGEYRGVAVYGAGSSVTNAGTITSGTGDAIFVDVSATVSNNASQSLISGVVGVYLQFSGDTITNAGTIIGKSDGLIALGSTTTITNSGTIIGKSYGVTLDNNNTLINSGTIIGTTAVYFRGGSANLLIIDGGATFVGAVTAGAAAHNTLELAAASGAGTISSLGTQFTGFQTLQIDSGANWLFGGANTLAAGGTLVNSGTGIVGSLLDVAGGIGGAGTLVVGSGATLSIGGTVGAAQTLDVAGAAALLQFEGTAGLSGTIVGFVPGTTIDLAALADTAVTTMLEAGNTLLVSNGTTTVTLDLDPSVAYGTSTFVTSSDAAAGTDIVVTHGPYFWAAPVSGQFGTGGDWVGGTAPGAGDIAVFATGTATPYAVSGNGGVATIDIGDTVTLSGGISATSSVDIGLFGGQTGSLTVGGTLTTPALFLNATGAALTVASGGMVVGYVDATSLATITNAGTIAGGSSKGVAVHIAGGNTISNSGTILGSPIIGYLGTGPGVSVTGSTGTVVNTGTIIGGFGIAAAGTVVVSNVGSASLILGVGRTGIYAGAITITNAGSIIAPAQDFSVSGAVSISNSGTIIETGAGGTALPLANSSNSFVNNTGTIIGSTAIAAAGTIMNSGSIIGGTVGVSLGTATGSSAKLVDLGFIGGETAIMLNGFVSENLVVLDSTAVISGKVTSTGEGAQNTLELASETGAGTISSLGTQYTGFQTVEIDTGAGWTFTGTNTLANGGALITPGLGTVAGVLVVTGGVSGGGTLMVESGGTLRLDGSIGAGETLDLAGAGALLGFGSSNPATVYGFAPGTTLDLQSLADTGGAATVTLEAGNTLLVNAGASSQTVKLNPAANYSLDRFITGGDGAAGTDITLASEVPPTAVNDSYNAAENGTLTVSAATGVLANDVDPNANTTLGAALVNGPSFGSVTLNADGSFTYTPNAGFVGFDSFTYDDSDGFDTSNPATVSIDVSFVPQPSVISGTVAGQATNDETPITPFSNVTITDPNSGGVISSTFDNAAMETVTIAPSTTANGTLSDPNAATDGAVLSNGTFSIAGSTADVTAAIDALVFTPVAHEVAPGASVTTGFTLTDLNSEGQTATDSTTSVVATAVSDTPVIAGTAGGQTISDEGSLSPFSGVTITDPDFGAQETITLTLSAAANGTLSGNGLSLVAPGTYTLAAGAPSAVGAALDTVVFTPTAHQVAPGGSVTTGITITDTDNHATSATDTTTSITASAASDTPSVSGLSGSQSVTGDGTVSPFATAAIIDPDAGAQESVTITLTDGGVATDADGTLAGAGLTKTGVGTYTLATGSPAAVSAALAALTFTSTLAPDTNATTVLSLSDSDNHGTAIAATVTLSGANAAAAPVISATATGQPGLDTTPVEPLAGVTITDANGIGQTETVTVTPSFTLNGVFSDSVGGAVSRAGAYSVSGSAAAVSAALDALTFTPTLHQVAPGQTVATSFALAVTDTAGQSASATASVIVTAVNDPPAVTVPNAAPSVPNQVSYPVFPGVTISDPDTGQTETATVTLSAAIGMLSDASGTVAPGGQSYSVSGSPAAVAAALRGLVFTPAQGIGEPGTTLTATATLAVSDGIATTNSTVNLAAPQSSTPFAYLDNVAAGASGSVTVTIGLLTAVAGTFYDLGIGTLSADGSTYTVTGPTAAVDAALAGVLFTPASPSSNRTPAVRAALSGGVTFSADPQAVLSTGTAAATLVGGAGSVTIQAGAGGGVFVGGTAGQNMLTAMAAGTTLLGGGAGDSIVAAASGGDVLVAGAGGETLNGGASASGNVLFGAGSGATSIEGGAGHDTVVTEGGSTTVTGGSGGSLFYLGGGQNLVQSQGADTIVAATGSDSIIAGGAGDLVFTGAASTLFVGGSAASTVVGGTGSLTVFGGAGGGVFFGGGAGGNILSAGTGAATLVGGGSGDVLTAANAASDALAAGAGNETLNAAGSSGAVAVFGGSGADQVVLGAGPDIFVAGGGSAVVTAGRGADVFTFLAGGAGSTTISGFVAGTDKVLLVGYGAGAATAAMQGLTVSGGNSSVMLSDGTRITFAGVTALPGGTFG